jgi:hypothetical protein
MRASELLASEVVDAAGRRLGPVRDVRLSRDGFRVVGLVVGEGPFAGIAHGWGYAEGRASGPAPLGWLSRRAVRRSRFAAAERVLDWGPGVIRLGVEGHDLPALAEERRR